MIMLTHLFLAFSLMTSGPTVSDAVIEDGIHIHRVTSDFQPEATLIRVLLPQQIAAGERLPTVYLLPVQANLEDRYGDGLAEAKRLKIADQFGVICVAPTFAQLPWYADHPTDSAIRQESHFVKVVIPAVEQRYPVRAEAAGRLLCGFSKSGYGAWSLLLRFPDHFGKAAAWDAPLMKAKPDQFGMESIYGTVEQFQKYRIDELLRARAELLRGNSDRPQAARLIHLGYGNFRDHHQQAETLLTELQIPHEYAGGPKRAHSWTSGWLEEAIRRLAR